VIDRQRRRAFASGGDFRQRLTAMTAAITSFPGNFAAEVRPAPQHNVGLNN
jgi:hypothetical protein